MRGGPARGRFAADGGSGLAARNPGKGVALLLLVAVFLGGCAGSSRPAVLPASPPVVLVTMDEYRFDYEPAIPPGRVVFRVHNADDIPHRLSLLSLPEDLPPIEDQLRGSERRVLTPFAGVHTRLPGESGAFAVDLEAGRRYALVCFLQDPDGTSHALKGMASEFRTR